MRRSRASASCNTLVDLTGCSPPARVTSLIPVCESTPCLYHEDLDLEPTTALHSIDDEPLYLPKNPHFAPLDEYLSTIPLIRSRSQQLLTQSNPIIELCDNNTTKYLNVLQGEIAHALASQAEVLVSAAATTCHIVAVRSTTTANEPLVSLAHIDKVAYDSCLDAMLQQHVQHHHHHHHRTNTSNHGDEYGFFWDNDNNEQTLSGEIIEMEVHMVGGYLDSNGTSQELSTWLLQVFSKLALKYRDWIHMKLSTAAISCMNTFTTTTDEHDTTGSTTTTPVGRGLGIETSSGRVFLVHSIPTHLQGPAIYLRSARAFSKTTTTKQEDYLQVIHDSTQNGELVIEPFYYEPFEEMELLLKLPDETLLQVASTSPECESQEFCTHVRKTLGFIKRVPSCEIFGKLCDKPLVYKRSKSIHMLNEWEMSTL